jgi:hypothetical protein
VQISSSVFTKEWLEINKNKRGGRFDEQTYLKEIQNKRDELRIL